MVDGSGENAFKRTFDDVLEVVPAFVKTVIGKTILREVVGFNFFCPHTPTNGLRTFIFKIFESFCLFLLPETGTE